MVTLFGKTMRLAIITAILCAVAVQAERPTQNTEKKAVLICLATEQGLRHGCHLFSERLRQHKWDLLTIELGAQSGESAENNLQRVRNQLPDNLPLTAPIVVYGHGGNIGGKHFLEYDRDREGFSLVFEGERLLSIIRERAPQNPVWVSSCQSGFPIYANDVCTGTSCASDEYSVSFCGLERTLFLISDLIANESEFKIADANRDGALNSSEIRMYFCRRFELGTSRWLRLTTREKKKDPFAKDYKENIYLPDRSAVDDYISNLRYEARRNNPFVSLRTYPLKQFRIIGDQKWIRNAALEKRVFKSKQEAESWAAKNLVGWPYYGSSGLAQSLGFSTISSARVLEEHPSPDLLVEILTPDDSTECKIWDTGKKAPNFVAPGWQTPQFNNFQLYSPQYPLGAPHAAKTPAERPTH